MTPRTVSRLAHCLVLPLLAACALANCGCLLVAAGTAVGAATGVAYLNGKVSATYFAYPQDVWMATRQGLTELKMPLLKETYDGVKGSLESRTPDGDKVFLTMECLSPAGTIDGALTRLSIRIASFGDRQGSEFIFQQIGMHVPTHMLPQATSQAPFSGGASFNAPAVGVGVKPLTANLINSPPLTPGNPLNIPATEQTIVPTSGQTGPPPLADPAPETGSRSPNLPQLRLPTEPSRINGA